MYPLNLETDPEKLRIIAEEYAKMDKTKVHIKDCGDFSIVTFWEDATPKSLAGWFHRVIQNGDINDEEWLKQKFINIEIKQI